MISKILQILGLQAYISKVKSFSPSLEQFFLTVGQNNFGNKIPLSTVQCNVFFAAMRKWEKKVDTMHRTWIYYGMGHKKSYMYPQKIPGVFQIIILYLDLSNFGPIWDQKAKLGVTKTICIVWDESNILLRTAQNAMKINVIVTILFFNWENYVFITGNPSSHCRVPVFITGISL